MKVTLEWDMPPQHTAGLMAWLSAAPDADVKGTEDHQDRQHDEHGHDNDSHSGVAEVVETAVAWRSGSHRVTVPEDILTETVKLLDAEGFQGAASRLLRCAVSEKPSPSERVVRTPDRIDR